MNKLRSTVACLLTTSLMLASHQEVFQEAVMRNDAQAVRALLQYDDVNPNVGFGENRKPALNHAIQNLASQLRDNGEDIAFWLMATAFAGVAIGGLYLLLKTNDEMALEIPAEIVTPEQPATTPAPEQTPVPAPAPDVTVAATVPAPSVDASSSTPAAEPTPAAAQTPEQKKVQKKKVEFGLKVKKAKDRVTGALAAISGSIGAWAAAHKAKSSKPVVKTAAVEDNLNIIRMLSRHPMVDIFASDEQGETAWNMVAKYLSEFDEYSECHTCMQEVKYNLASQSVQKMYELYNSLLEQQGSLEKAPCADCPCDNCVCEECDCVTGSECSAPSAVQA